MRYFPFYKQLDAMDCGPTCLRMIAKYYGKNYSLPFLREKCYIDKAGVSLKGISEAADLIGLGIFYFEYDCNYNPYIGKWEGEDGFMDLNSSGVSIGPDGTIINKKVLNQIIQELYETLLDD